MNSRQGGFSLAELLVVVVLGALVMGSIYQMVVMQDRTTREQYAIVETQQNARMTLSVLTSDLKEISAADGDVTAADSTSISFRALRKAGIACGKDPLNNYLDVGELGDAFVAGDSVLVFADGANTSSSADDTWLRLRVTAVAVGVCAANPLNATVVRRLTFGGSPLANVQSGALVRSFLPTRYRLVNNGEWGQLMRTENGTETAIIDKLATLADGGLRLRYFDINGNAITSANLANAASRAQIMRMQVKVRGKGVSQVSRTGTNRYQDSLVTTVYMRGNQRNQ
jgi:prepilin-type N-terminal cleavage/methylation domain-containing protein